jgi:2'-5' RNA ligase
VTEPNGRAVEPIGSAGAHRGAGFQPAGAGAPDVAEVLRLFVAVELSRDLKRALEGAAQALQRAGADDGLRWVRPEGIHLTLKFLGATLAARVPAIADALRAHLHGAPAFELQPRGFDAFHGGKRAAVFRTWRESYRHSVRVIFVGLTGDTEALAALAERLEAALEPLGFPREDRPFFGHLTLARVREDSTREQRERISAAMDGFPHASDVYTGRRAAQDVPFPALRVASVSLMQSTLQRGGAEYRALATFPLGG